LLGSINSTQNEAAARDEGRTSAGAGFHDIHCSLMMLTRLAVGLEPLNTLDAAHRSPRSSALSRTWNLVPPLNRPLVDPLSETKNCWKSLLGAKDVNRNRELLLLIAATFDPTCRRTMLLQCRAC